MEGFANIEADLDGSGTSRADYVYSVLRRAILDGILQPGQRLREIEIATELGVSRTPVREALTRLESSGLATFTSPRGMMVSQLTRQQVLELYALRENLEGLAARLSSRHASWAEIETLRDCVRREKEQQGADPSVLANLNKRFHAVIYDAARNRYLLETLSSIRGTQALLRGTSLSAPDRTQAAYQEHLEIVNAIDGRDPDRAEAMAREHIRNALQARLKLMALTNQDIE